MAAALVGGLGLGLLGASLFGKGDDTRKLDSDYNASAYSPSVTAAAGATPIDVATTETGTTNNDLMEEEREKEKKRLAALNSSILTSGLGASGMASTSKKTLLGG
jgi:hypothetical protein